MAALVTAAGGVLAVRLWRARRDGTRPLLPVAAMLLSPLFVLAIVFTGASNVVINPCR